MSRPDYEYLWRPSVEAYPAIGWFVASIVGLGFTLYAGFSLAFTAWMLAAAALMGALRVTQLFHLWITKTRLQVSRLDVMPLEELFAVVNASREHNAALLRRSGDDPSKANSSVYLGNGFDIQSQHTQRLYDLKRLDIREVAPPWIVSHWIAKNILHAPIPDDRTQSNSAWIHAIEPNKRPILQTISQQAGHTIVVGATGAGKTTCMIAQSILRAMQGHVVVAIDPKGADDYEEALRRLARKLGRPFVLIDPARPNESARVSLLASFNRYTELPSRLVSLMNESDFKAFGWCFTSRYVAGMLMAGSKPTVLEIKRLFNGGAEAVANLLEDCVRVWMRAAGIDNPESVLPEGKAQAARVDRFVAAYKTLLSQYGANDVIEGLIATYRHNAEHMQKVTLNLIPILEKLTAADLGSLFSPDGGDIDDMRPMWDFESMVDQRAIVYFRLDSLADSDTGSAIGSMGLSNLVAVASNRYNQGKSDVRVSVNVDELAEVANIPFIQLENKGRGALFDLCFFTQSIQDLTARFGATSYRDMILANANNMISFRVADPETMKFVMTRLGKTEIPRMTFSQSLTQKTDDNVLHFNGQVSRQAQMKEVDRFPIDLLPMLGNLEYVAVFQGAIPVKGMVPIVDLKQMRDAPDDTSTSIWAPVALKNDYQRHANGYVHAN
ncbi:MAG: conjugative transfer system coupling protein TraD [Rhodocyclaceae bacterium]|nr:conjugative transfer system coupling protein TraD [Rhodocyclaceae bacterium]MCA3025598.1 conjugative transfer system coupling protein TraD [Rhodocyclaceae bacterium]MCA3032873.1 conjugative transfer system coupling protein TraD [Rhodocyclaceae bacterium]MCA3037313.1 conjugative transfer system coupling protein TraD [Rhodocyclaceae bacterium]MCA3046382.1 conjugative transfer system coupling protein TraD [Rhodocyclaceae bacterium]